jgi:hypothetical protein
MTTRHRWRPRCRIAHGWKKSDSFVSQQRDILPCTLFFFHPLDSPLSYLSCHSSSLFFFSFFLFFNHSLLFPHTHIFFPLLFIFLSFFYIHIFFSLLFPLLTSLSLFSKLSTPLFIAYHNLIFKIKPC